MSRVEEGRTLRRIDEIRKARNEMKRLVDEAKKHPDEPDEWRQVVLPVDLLEAIGIWLDKALLSARYQTTFMPDGEYDHASRVSRAFLGLGANVDQT